MKNGSQQHARSARGKQSRALILSTTFEVLAELGPEATTLRHVARRAGVNIATLMYYFPSKEALVAEVTQAQEGGELYIVEKWYGSLSDQRLSQLDSLKEALTELGILVIDRVIADPGRFRLWVYTTLETPKAEAKSRLKTPASELEEHHLEISPSKKTQRRGSPEKAVVRAALVRALELGTIRCEEQEIDDYIEGYIYLSRGFALDHIQEITLDAEHHDKIIRRFRKLIRRYVHNMLPVEKD
jgi:AcrR family transcriptional regulator